MKNITQSTNQEMLQNSMNRRYPNGVNVTAEIKKILAAPMPSEEISLIMELAVAEGQKPCSVYKEAASLLIETKDKNILSASRSFAERYPDECSVSCSEWLIYLAQAGVSRQKALNF